MNLRIYFLVVTATALGLVSLFALGYTSEVDAQQPDSWSAWLYDPQTGSAWRVDANGNLQQTLGLPVPNGGALSPSLGVSPDGRYLSYTGGDISLYIYDSYTLRLITDYTLPEAIRLDSFDLGLGSEQFREDGAQIAYAYERAAGGWRVDVIDTATGSVSASLDGNALGLPASGVPLIFDVSAGRVLFNLRDSAGAWIGYGWDTAAGTVSATGMRLDDEYDVFRRTGDLIMPGDLTSASVTERADALLVYHVLSGQAYPFYAQPGAELHMPRFIQNGERIVVSLRTMTGEAPLIVERDGDTVGSLPANADIEDVFGTPDGLIYTIGSQLWSTDTRDSLTTSVLLANFPAPAQIAWVDSLAADYGPYEGWANLSPHMPARATLTPYPTPPGFNSPLNSIDLDTRILVEIGNRAGQPPLAGTPIAVVTMPPPTPSR